MATKADIRQQVGEDLGLVPVGQLLESQDQIRIDSAYDSVYARLKELGLATWAVAGDIPTKLVPYVALLMAEKLLISYSVPESRYVRIKNEVGVDGQTAISNIAEMIVPEYESTDTGQDF